MGWWLACFRRLIEIQFHNFREGTNTSPPCMGRQVANQGGGRSKSVEGNFLAFPKYQCEDDDDDDDHDDDVNNDINNKRLNWIAFIIIGQLRHHWSTTQTNSSFK